MNFRMSLFKILRQTAVLIFCLNQVQASELSLSCAKVYSPPSQLGEARPSREALAQIQKDLQGNRPLLAVLRGAKKDPQLDAALVYILRSLSPTLQANLLAQTGFEIQNEKLVLLKETKITDKTWLSELTKQALELLKEEAQKTPPPADQVNVSLQVLHLNNAALFQNEIWYLRYALNYILRNPHPSWVRRLEFVHEFAHLLATEGAAYYFLSEVGHFVGPNATLYKANGPLSAVQVKGVFKALLKREGPSSPLAFEQEKEKFISQVRDFSRRSDEAVALLQSQKLSAMEEKNSQGHLPETSQSAERKASSFSLRELLNDLNAEEDPVICAQLSDLIRSVDSSARRNQLVAAALRDQKPQIKLLEMAYELKQHNELTQKEIQAAVFTGLDQITSPSLSVAKTLETIAPVATETVPAEKPQSPDEPARTESSVLPKNSEIRIAGVKRALFSADSFAASSLRVTLHNEKEFFEVFRPGTAGFARLESDAEGMKEKLQRVAHAFTTSGSPEGLAGDGHFGRFNHRIFSLRWGTYRLLLGLDKSAKGPVHLVVLNVYQKSASNDSAKKEDHFYDLAERRRLGAGY
jgi:hypothetical protein